MRITALCHTCAYQHAIEFDPAIGPGAAFSDWEVKHPGHDIEYQSPRRSQRDVQAPAGHMHYLHNADAKIAYAASSAPTMTLAANPASSSLLVGQESASISNATNKYLNYLIAGKFRQASGTLNAGLIQVGVVGARDDTPNWPDAFAGTNSQKTITTEGNKQSILMIGAQITTISTTQSIYYFGPFAVAGLFGDVCPRTFSLFVTHTAHTGANTWHGTEGEHAIQITPTYLTV